MKFELERTARGLSDEELCEDLRKVARQLGRKTVTISEYNEHGIAHATTITRRFGSWPKALEDAGLNPSRSRIGITDDELYENLRKVWMSIGRQPRLSEMKHPISEYSGGTYEKRFGRWSQALHNFVEWVNSDETTGFEEPKIEVETRESPGPRVRRTKREITDRMRFRVLMRDGFTCRTCGASPIKCFDTELHVDHIIPWSKGGETIEENLTTKCLRCNLGKGNAFNA